MSENVKIAYKVSPQGLHYFEAEITRVVDGLPRKHYHVGNQMRRTPRCGWRGAGL